MEQVQNTLDELNVENRLTGRIDVDDASDAQVYKDSRPIKYGAVWARFGGMALGFAMVIGFGLMDRRFRSPADAKIHMQNSPMLGVLPNLPDDLSDPEQAAVTAHYRSPDSQRCCRFGIPAKASRSSSITSPVSGTGKTSLTLALGVSFAAASKTLLIDCDLVGGGLTQPRQYHRQTKNWAYPSKRRAAYGSTAGRSFRRLANGSRRRLGEILVELGFLKENELADAARGSSRSGNVGLLDGD